MGKDISTHILTYRGKVLMVRHIENTDMINFTVHGYSKDARQFVKQKERERQLGMEWPGIRVTGFECIVEYVTGIKQPCLLVENRCGRTEQLCLHFFFLVNASSLAKIASFNLCSSISRPEYKLNDGPCVSWLHRNCLELLRWNTISKSLEHSSHICTSDGLYSSLKLLWSGMMNNKLIAIATLTTEANKTEWLCIDFERGLVPSERILPSVYSSTALCCYVTDDDTVRQWIYIGTSSRQLIGIQRGKLVGHCQLPFDDPYHIISMETEEGSTYVMVQSKKNKVCAINCIQSKIVHEWSNKAIILIDDFLERGTDQLCLLQGSFRDDLTIFSLTNMNDICITSEQESPKQERQTQNDQNLESLHITIQALQTRLQANTVLLNDKIMERDEKREMIDATCSILQRMTLAAPKTTNTQQTKIKGSNCVCLIEGRAVVEEVELTSEEEKEACFAQPVVGPRVLDVWQRLLVGKWAVGIELENKERSPMTDISFSLVSVKEGNVKSWCYKLFDTNNPRLVDFVPSDQNEGFEGTTDSQKYINDCVSYPKRRKVHENSGLHEKSELKVGEKTCVVTVTELPSFERGPKYSCSLVLSWTRYHEDDPPCRKAINCGYVDLSVDQLDELNISNTSRRLEDTMNKRRDVLAVRAVSTETTLLLSSTMSTLFDVVHVIRQELQLPDNVVGDMTSLNPDDCLRHAYDTNGSLQGVAVLIRPGYKQAQLHLFTRCSSQIYILCHRLRRALPDDVIIDVNDSAETKAEAQVLEIVQRYLKSMTDKSVKKEQSLNNNKSQKREDPEQNSSDLIDVSDTKLKTIRIDYEKKRKV